MLQNTIKILLRNLKRHKFFGFLNILGLVSGISAAVLILLISDFELSYDDFHPNVENKYVMALDAKIGENEAYHIDTPPVLSPTLQQQMGGVKSATRTWNAGQLLMARGTQAFFQDDIYLVDSNFFQFFGYELLQGDAKEVLNQPQEVVLTSTAAKKYFGKENPMGKTVAVGNERESYMVTGIAVDPPENSHLQFEALLSFVSHEESQAENWGHNELNTYAELEKDVGLADFQARLDALVEKEARPFLLRAFNKDFEAFKKAGKWLRYDPVLLTDLHLYHPELG